MMEVIGFMKFLVGLAIAGLVFIPTAISLFIQKYFAEILLLLLLVALIGIKNKKFRNVMEKIFE